MTDLSGLGCSPRTTSHGCLPSLQAELEGEPALDARRCRASHHVRLRTHESRSVHTPAEERCRSGHPLGRRRPARDIIVHMVVEARLSPTPRPRGDGVQHRLGASCGRREDCRQGPEIGAGSRRRTWYRQRFHGHMKEKRAEQKMGRSIWKRFRSQQEEGNKQTNSARLIVENE